MSCYNCTGLESSINFSLDSYQIINWEPGQCKRSLSLQNCYIVTFFALIRNRFIFAKPFKLIFISDASSQPLWRNG